MVPCSPATNLERRQRAVYNESSPKPVFAATRREPEKVARDGVALSDLVFETHRRLGEEGTTLLRDLVTVQPVHAWTMERVLVTAEADTCSRALGTQVATVSGTDFSARDLLSLQIEASKPRKLLSARCNPRH